MASALHELEAPPLGATTFHFEPTLTVFAAETGTSERAAIELVVGASMRGIALNDQLVAAGGRFRHAVRTAPCYRFYARTGSSPPRPGLLRPAADAPLAGAIDAERRALPPGGFARFVALLPAPLCIATVELEDAATAKGFLVESIGKHDAQDITSLGGWRRFHPTPA